MRTREHLDVGSVYRMVQKESPYWSVNNSYKTVLNHHRRRHQIHFIQTKLSPQLNTALHSTLKSGRKETSEIKTIWANEQR